MGVVRADPPGVYAIRNARVVTVSGAPVARGVVVVRDGLIEAVGASVAIPPDAWVIEGEGLTVYPGLIDALSSIGIPASAPAAAPSAAAAAPRRGGSAGGALPVTKGPEDRPSCNSWARAADLFDPADSRIAEARSAGFTAAVVYPTSGVFAGQGALIQLAPGQRRRLVVASPAGQYLAIERRGYAGEFPASLLGAIAYVRQVYLDAASYRLEKAAWEKRATAAGRPDYDRALEGVLECPRALLPARSAVEIDRMIRFGAELKTPVVLYGGHEAYRAATRLAATSTPILVSLKWPERARDGDPDEPVLLRTLELWEHAPESPAALAKAGARFAFYSDGAAPRDVAKAVKRALDAGLSVEAAVRAFTLGAAEIYGLQARLGSIDKGKIANLVVTDGELFREQTKVKYIFVDGEKYEPAPAPATPGARGESAPSTSGGAR
jgi:imidazolonepropionase-like amidohydrolase